ncbi:thiamine pyrophosphate-dependent enzyme [Parafrankia sp. EUN1f]|uniref:thiamine pyrophosphate-dependent enzyme n=1 Tax=Parafrankia sp. EUN1f TaxID=102897 RepID=UPI0001C46363|nr:thiamine pyrophosphate-dependent enzyme [Parafrankia sp. EUN1f]EFC81435.1 3-methyl-2-oxobutanoate dehydrogenase (2-methylpropanoyl-transferring) [Parafrankia sp. EUN1f]
MTALSPQFLPEHGAAVPRSVLLPDGTPRPGVVPSLDDDQVVAALELMLLSRAFDEKAFSLQRQGRFGTFSPVHGQEASVVGSAFAVEPGHDWIVPQYRELPALLRHGLPLESFMQTFMGDPRGGAIPPGVNLLPIQIGLAAQLPQAVGLAWGRRLRGDDAVVLVYVGDGASSEGDFHEACNLAGVLRAPVVFLLQNNGWAISTPRSRQSAAATLAARAPGYGFPGVLVDGNDLLAVHAVVAEAVTRARAGDGPTLVESLTYRVGAHNTADDPSRYVPGDALREWQERDPLSRVRGYLRARGSWDDEREIHAAERIRARIDAAVRVVESTPPPGAPALFDHVSAQLSDRQRRQRADLLAQPETT